jgi:hypothetical protein
MVKGEVTTAHLNFLFTGAKRCPNQITEIVSLTWVIVALPLLSYRSGGVGHYISHDALSLEHSEAMT